MDGKDTAAPSPRRWKRFIRGVAVLAILFLVALSALPVALSTAPARRALVRAVNQEIAPGRIELGGISLSWTRGVALLDVVLIDPRGKTVVTAESVRTERGILGLLASQFDYGTIQIDGATVDLERRADGSIDVMEALGGLLGGTSGPQEAAPRDGAGDGDGVGSGLAAAVIVHGVGARIASPELAEPIAASGFTARAEIVPGKPLDVVVTLAEEDRSLELQAGYDLNAAPGAAADLTLKLTGKDWPLAASRRAVTVRGRFEGAVQADRRQGLWSVRSDAVLRGTVADGPALAGDRLALDQVAVDCDAAETNSGWSIRKLDLKSPVAELSAVGRFPTVAGAPTRLSGHVDLAAVSKMLPHAVPLRSGVSISKGQARISADLNRSDDVERIVVSADLADLIGVENGRGLALRTPAALSASLTRTRGNTTVESFSVKAAGIDAVAKGDLQHGVTLSGAVDLAAIEEQARELIDLGAVRLAGKGRVAADYRPDGASFKARLAAELDGLRVQGLTAEPIARDHVRLEAGADGPRRDDGAPADWRTAGLSLDAGETKARLLARAAAGAPTVVVDVSTPITYPAPGVVSARATARRSGAVYELDQVQWNATPADPRAASAALSLTAKGTFDPAAGRLTMVPEGPQPAAAVVVAAPGFTLTGIGKSDSPLTLDAVVWGDLSALDQALVYWTGTTPRGVGGGWSSQVNLTRQVDGRLTFKGWVNSPNLFATAPRGPVNLVLDASYAPDADQLSLASVDLTTTYARFVGGGTVAQLTGGRLADVSGALEPRWEAVDPLVASTLGGDARVRATVKPFRLRGSLAAESTSQLLKGMEGALEVDLATAQAFGVQVGPTPVVLRLGGGKAVFDPIAATINGGRLEVGADLFLDDPAALWLRLAKGTRIENAAINQAVSNDVLSYIAPVLAKASNLSGSVSLAVDGALIPLIGDGSLRVDGQLVFNNVAFRPGPLATEIVTLTGNAAPALTLHEPLQLQIADGRVKQSGLTIPLPDQTTAKLSGSVGFDKTLALRAVVPITPRMLGGNAAVNEYVGGTEVAVPIGGTISHPTIDRSGLRVALREAARSMIKRGVRVEAGRLLDQVVAPAVGGGPANPNTPRSPSGDDAFKALEGIGRDLLRSRR